MKKMHLIMAVWGKSYIDLFLKLSLPSQLAPGNLPSLNKQLGFTYKIYTTVEGKAYLRKQDIFVKLTKLIDTKIISVDKIQSDDKFSPLMGFHNQAIQEADAENAALIFLSPDFILADGALLKVMQLWQAGFRAVMVLTLRLSDASLKKELLEKYYNEQNQTLNLKPRQMVRLCLKHLHPIEKTYFWGGRFSSFPIHAYWPVQDEGLTARCFYLHPLMVDPLVKFVLPNITIDADYVDLACYNSSLIHVVQDSDELCCFEITNAATHDANAPEPTGPAKSIKYGRWATVHANPVYNSLMHHMYFQVPIRIHSGPITRKWLKAERQAKTIARRVRLFTFFFRRHGNLANAFDFYLTTKIKSPPVRSLIKTGHNPLVRRGCCGYTIDYCKSYPGADWGLAEKNERGQKWRWINSAGQSSTTLNLRQTKNYVLKTLIHTALGNSLYRLEVLVNGHLALQQQIISEDNQIFHWCILPRRTGSEQIVLTFRINPNEPEDRLALSLSYLKPTRYEPRLVYAEYRKKIGSMAKSILRYLKVN